jgi:hypothetical protein
MAAEMPLVKGLAAFVKYNHQPKPAGFWVRHRQHYLNVSETQPNGENDGNLGTVDS